MSALHIRLKELYAKEGGVFPDPIRDLDWSGYKVRLAMYLP